MQRKLLYRPQTGSLAEAINRQKEFKTDDEMFDYVANEWHGLIAKENLSLGEDLGEDERIGWLGTRMVLTSRIGDLRYDIPQCVGWSGYQSIEDGVPDLKPCPFCGGVAEFHEDVPYIDYCSQGELFISCKSCGVRTEKTAIRPYFYGLESNCGFKKLVCDMWNKRANEVSQE
jgi:hypothetical protein